MSLSGKEIHKTSHIQEEKQFPATEYGDLDPKYPLMTVAIIGGGAGGCFTALELAETGRCKVEIFEMNSELMGASSNVSPGRMGLGFHYADVNTAIFTLHLALKFTKRFGEFRQEHDRPHSHPLRRGRYFIMKNSLVSREDILNTYEILKNEYVRLVNIDKSNELFGPPENFYRILEPSEYEEDVIMDNIDIGIETAEELLDWPKLRNWVVQELSRQEEKGSVEIHTQTEVVDLREIEKNGGYKIKTKKQLTVLKEDHTEHHFANVIVNCTWYNITKINKMLGVDDEKRCNRIKTIVTLDLPENLHDTPSMFFCMGPFCMFSNKGKGRGMITYASETNVAATTSPDLEEEFLMLYFSKPKAEKAQKIIDGVSRFIPKIKQAKMVKVERGVIQTLMDKDAFDCGLRFGNLDFIHDPLHGGIFKRDYSGVKVIKPGYIINACMKLMYCQENAELVKESIFENAM